MALLLVDARAGIVPADHALVAWLRTCCSVPLLLAANKAERRGRQGISGDCHSTCRLALLRRMLLLAYTPLEALLLRCVLLSI
jgi:predicted GTPase